MHLPPNITRQYFLVKQTDKLDTDGMTVVIAIRGVVRQSQLHQCIRWVLNQTLNPVEVIVVEEDITPRINLDPFKDIPNVRYLFIKSHNLFCKSACYNHGVSHATYNYICGLDADLLIPSEFLMNGYLHLQKCQACFIADDIFYIENDTSELMQFRYTGRTWKTHRAPWQFHGGVFLIRKQVYYDIGGHDEQFIGYGSEDSDFYKRCHDLLYVTTDNFAILHIDHERDVLNDAAAEKNKLYLEHISDTPLNTRIKLLKSYNQYLKGEMLDTPVTIFPDISPKKITAESKTMRILPSKSQEEITAASAKTAREMRRKRLLGL